MALSADNPYLTMFLDKLNAAHGVLKRPVRIKICRRITRQLLWPVLKPFYNLRARGADAAAKRFNNFYFEALQVSRNDATARYSEACRSIGVETTEKDSIHGLCFAALAVSGFEPNNILEIGSENGDVANLLAALFPKADIHTVELGPEDPFYNYFHWQGAETYERHIKKRLDHPRIHSIRINTLHLLEQDLPEFDLIWLDGGHEFPEVAWDHFYCLSRLSEDGWLFTDDLIAPGSVHRQCDDNAADSWNTIKYLNARIENKFALLLKRETGLHLVRDKKFVGVMSKKVKLNPQSGTRD